MNIHRLAFVIPKGHEDFGTIKVRRAPLGVCSIATYLKNKGYECRIFHQTDERDSNLIQKVREFDPEMACFSTMTPTHQHGLTLAQTLKEKNPDILTVFGGDHIPGCYTAYNGFPGLLEQAIPEDVDYGIPFEGEISLLNLLTSLNKGLTPKNVIQRKGSNILLPEQRNRAENLDVLPVPDRGILPMGKYFGKGTKEPKNFALQHNSRGCGYRCTFCSTPITHPGKIRANSPKRVVEESQELVEKHGIDFIFYCDEYFTHNKQRVYDICQEITKRGLEKKFGWRIFARPDIDEELLKEMKKAGLKKVYYGIESMNYKTLKRLKKGTTPETIRRGVDKAKKVGLGIWGSLMIGYPWESEEELKRSLDDYLNLDIDGVTYPPFLTPFPGTPLFGYCKENNLLTEENFSRYTTTIPVIKTPIPEERLLQIREDFIEKAKLD